MPARAKPDPLEPEPVQPPAAPMLPGADALQSAALQMIAAAKAFLDIAEQAVQDPQVLGQVAAVVGTMAKGVVGSLGALAGAAQVAAGAAKAGDDDPPLEHIAID